MKKLFIIFLMIVILSINVFAFGVSSPFYDDNPLVLVPGDFRDVALTMQNMAGASESVMVKVEVVSGKDIVEILDKEELYNVPAGGEVKSNFRVKMPKNAQPGDEWNVIVEFKTINQKERGMISVGLGMKIDFKVVATEAPKKEEVLLPSKKGIQPMFFALVIIAILMVLALLMFKSFSKKTVKKRKNKKNFK